MWCVCVCVQLIRIMSVLEIDVIVKNFNDAQIDKGIGLFSVKQTIVLCRKAIRYK